MMIILVPCETTTGLPADWFSANWSLSQNNFDNTSAGGGGEREGRRLKNALIF